MTWLSDLPERFRNALHVAAACGEPEAHYKDDPKAEWGDLEEDYAPRSDVTASTLEEVVDYYESGRPEDIQIN